MYFLIAIGIIVLDQLSKWLVVNSMQLGEVRVVLGKLAELCYIHNNGSAFSMFQGKQTFLLVFTSILMIALIIYLIVCKESIGKAERVAIYMILGGGIGNMIDRILYGYVIDFFNIHIIPIFNVADIAITCGCILFAIAVLFEKKK